MGKRKGTNKSYDAGATDVQEICIGDTNSIADATIRCFISELSFPSNSPMSREDQTYLTFVCLN